MDGGRRRALGTLAVFACLPFASGMMTPATAHARHVPTAPVAPFVLKRRVVRGLSDGNEIAITREWSCRFETIGTGQRITGSQISVEVLTPPILETLAALERKRASDDMFPIALDQSGLIVRQPDKPAGDEMGEAVRECLRLYRVVQADEQTIASARLFLTEIHNKAAAEVSRIPRDLFYPRTGEHREERALPLPDGTRGRIEIVVTAETEEETGLLQSHSRAVLTHTNGSVRRSMERWELRAA